MRKWNDMDKWESKEQSRALENVDVRNVIDVKTKGEGNVDVIELTTQQVKEREREWKPWNNETRRICKEMSKWSK